MLFIFLNPLSEVTNGSCRKPVVAAIIRNTIQTSFKFPKMFAQGFLFAPFGNMGKRFFYFFFGDRFFNFYNHITNIIKIFKVAGAQTTQTSLHHTSEKNFYV